MIIEWTEPAELDIADIYDYLARDVPIYAEQFVDQIVATVDLLYEQPLMGRVVPEAKRNDVRELIFQNYRIMYQATPNCLYIIAVIHGKRDVSTFKQKPWRID